MKRLHEMCFKMCLWSSLKIADKCDKKWPDSDCLSLKGGRSKPSLSDATGNREEVKKRLVR